MAWADRIAYVCHDFEDAVTAGIVKPEDLPAEVAEVVGTTRRLQLHGFITAMVETIAESGVVAMRRPEADALAAFRAFNYERIYLRPDSVDQADRAARLISSLTEYFIDHPDLTGEGLGVSPGSDKARSEAVRYVSGMTDRFANQAALNLLGWSPEALPRT